MERQLPFDYASLVGLLPCRIAVLQPKLRMSGIDNQFWRFAPLSVPRLLKYSPGWSKRTQRLCELVNPKATHCSIFQHSFPHASRFGDARTRKPLPEKALPLKYSMCTGAPEELGVPRSEITPLMARAFIRSWPVSPFRKHFRFQASYV